MNGDNQSCWILQLMPTMCVNDQITWEKFEQKFRAAFGRESTPEEHHWFYSISSIVNETKQAKANAAAV